MPLNFASKAMVIAIAARDQGSKAGGGGSVDAT